MTLVAKECAASEQTESLIPGYSTTSILLSLDNIRMKGGGHGLFSAWEEGEGEGINEQVFEICSIISSLIIPTAGCLDLQKQAVADNERETSRFSLLFQGIIHESLMHFSKSSLQLLLGTGTGGAIFSRLFQPQQRYWKPLTSDFTH